MNTLASIWPSPAKLNLFLYITGQRPNGYHDLQTLFQFLDVGDTLKIQVNQSGSIHLSPEISGLKLEDNLIYRAAKSLQMATKTKFGAAIELTKILPMGGGLGGGSSNAATTLVALNHLWNTELTTDELAKIGLTLGADVPIFIHGHAAFAEGIGEKFTEAHPAEPWYLVIVPKVHISTQQIFTHPALKRDTPKRPLATLLSQKYENDCEKIVRDLFVEVDMALSWLLEYAPSKLTGTGACVFAEFENKARAQAILAILPDWLTGFVARGMNTSPLITTLKAQTHGTNNI